MDAKQALTLSQTLPDAFLALLKRMPKIERNSLLTELRTEFPKEYAAWYSPEVQAYLRYLDALDSKIPYRANELPL